VVYGPSNTKRFSDSAGVSLPLLAYLVLAGVLMMLDYRNHIGVQVRSHLSVVIEPIWWIASLPKRMVSGVDSELALREKLQADNKKLQNTIRIANARILRLNAMSEENQRLRDLLDADPHGSLNVHMVRILDVDLNPYHQRIVLDAGKAQGVKVGQAVLDAGGIAGQVIEVSENKSIVLLVTDSEHAIPVQVVRSGLRSIALGTGNHSELLMPDIPQSADIRVGDVLVSSGMGGRFPAGFPVGVITQLKPDETRLFVIGRAKPAARLDQGLEVLLLDEVITATPLPPAAETDTPANTATTAAAPATANANNPGTHANSSAAAAPIAPNTQPSAQSTRPSEQTQTSTPPPVDANTNNDSNEDRP
jgi:rod shape-determining protein MreC